jgi:hypothetical protein
VEGRTAAGGWKARASVQAPWQEVRAQGEQRAAEELDDLFFDMT